MSPRCGSSSLPDVETKVLLLTVVFVSFFTRIRSDLSLEECIDGCVYVREGYKNVITCVGFNVGELLVWEVTASDDCCQPFTGSCNVNVDGLCSRKQGDHDVFNTSLNRFGNVGELTIDLRKSNNSPNLSGFIVSCSSITALRSITVNCTIQYTPCENITDDNTTLSSTSSNDTGKQTSTAQPTTSARKGENSSTALKTRATSHRASATGDNRAIINESSTQTDDAVTSAEISTVTRESKADLPVTAIAGSVAAIVVLIAAVIVVVFVVCKRRALAEGSVDQTPFKTADSENSDAVDTDPPSGSDHDRDRDHDRDPYAVEDTSKKSNKLSTTADIATVDENQQHPANHGRPLPLTKEWSPVISMMILNQRDFNEADDNIYTDIDMGNDYAEIATEGEGTVDPEDEMYSTVQNVGPDRRINVKEQATSAKSFADRAKDHVSEEPYNTISFNSRRPSRQAMEEDYSQVGNHVTETRGITSSDTTLHAKTDPTLMIDDDYSHIHNPDQKSDFLACKMQRITQYGITEETRL